MMKELENPMAEEADYYKICRVCGAIISCYLWEEPICEQCKKEEEE